MKVELLHKNLKLSEKVHEFAEKNGLLFNSEAWLQNYPAKQIQQCAILNNNGDVIGCFNYYIFKKAIFKIAISAPYSPDIDLFYLNPSESVVGINSFNKELLFVIAGYFNSLGFDHVNLNLPQSIIDTQPFIWKGYSSTTRYTYLIDLKRDEETLWNNLASEKRKSINKAVKDDITVNETNDYHLVFDLVKESLERNDKAKNLSIIKNILFKFANAGNSIAFIAYDKQKAIGATFCILTKEKAIYLFGGFDSKNKHHGAGVSCMWQSILVSKTLGLKYFDFEGSMNVNIERYFREFGGELVPYFSVRKTKFLLSLLMSLRGYKNF